MPTEKINDFLNCYFDTIKITDEKIITLIRNGIITRYNSYKDEFPTISIQDDNYKNYAIKNTNGYYDLEDFLLNRLFQGLREIVTRDDENATTCEYSSKNRTMYISEPAIRKTILIQINNWPDEIKEKFIDIILSTVFDHELGHALKTQFDGGYKVKLDTSKKIIDELFTIIKDSLGEEKATEVLSSVNKENLKSADQLYKELLLNLSTIKNGKYSSIILKPDELINSQSIDIGTGIDKQNETNEKELTLLDELLQETESMNYSELFNVPQRKVQIGTNGNYINIFHTFSGYSPILGYGKIFTSLLGVKGTFQATYLNPSSVFNEFNSSYKDIAENIFQNDLSPITNITQSLTKLMSTRSESNYLQLDLFFSKCYEQMIDKQLSENQNLNTEPILKEIDSFQTRLTNNDDESINNDLPHNSIFNKLKQRLSSFDNRDKKAK